MEKFYPVITEIKKNKDYSGRWILKEELIEMDFSNIYNLYSLYDKKEYVLKFMPLQNLKLEEVEELFLREFNTHEQASSTDISPKIIESWICEIGFILIIEKLDKTVSTLLKEYTSFSIKKDIVINVLKVIRKMHQQGICHGDTHTENFMVKINTPIILKENQTEEEKYKLSRYEYFVIDFGSTGDANIRDDYLIFASFIKCFFTNSELLSIFEPLNIFEKEDLKNLYD